MHPLLQILGAIVLLVAGGEALVRGASALAARLGVSALAIGLTVVAFGTSAPELAVSLRATLAGSADLAVGNVVGSNIANLALILGLTAIVRPVAVQARVIRLDLPVMLLVSGLLIGALAGGRVSRLEGVLLVVGLAAFVAFTFRGARRETAPVKEELATAAPARPLRLPLAAVLVAVGLGALTFGGRLLVQAAVVLATAWGVGEVVVGLTVVAVGTSLPELATSLVAAARGHGDIAVGNVVGSNIFNVLGILGVTAAVQPLAPGGITWVDLGAMVVLAAVAMVLAVSGRRVDRVEGAALLASFVAYTWYLVAS